MELFIDTSDKTKTFLEIKNSGKLIDSVEIGNNFDQAEKLLTGIDALLKKNDLKKHDLTGIFVNSEGDSFTSLRIGIITANALGYALGIGVKDFNNKSVSQEKLEIVCPKYSSEPNITVSKQKMP